MYISYLQMCLFYLLLQILSFYLTTIKLLKQLHFKTKSVRSIGFMLVLKKFFMYLFFPGY